MASAWTLVAIMAPIKRLTASGFHAVIANLLFQPKVIVILTIPAASFDPPSSHERRSCDRTADAVDAFRELS